MLLDDLLAFLFDGQSHLLAAPMATWLVNSRRFTAFVAANQTKIRKKLRTARDPQGLRDLELELETAYLLLQERSLSLAYEPQHPRLGRSPDFAVSYTTSLEFMVEVTRMRPVGSATQTGTPQNDQAAGSPFAEPSVLQREDRFSDMLCSKLGQLLPQRCNLLLVGVETPQPALPEVQAVMLRLQQRAESNDSSFTQQHGFRDRADFFHHYQRLSALLVRGIPLPTGEPVVLWINPQAKCPLPARVQTVLARSHTL